MAEIHAPSSRLAVIGSIHGNEHLPAEIVRAIAPDPELVTLIGHPEALEADVRYLGDEGEIGGLLPGDPKSPNPDRERATTLHGWLNQHNPWLTLSLHSNGGKIEPAEWLSINHVTTPAALAVGQLAGLRCVTVQANYPLNSLHPRLAEVDLLDDETTNPAAKVDDWLDLLGRIRQLGPQGMANVYNSYCADVRYYQLAKDIASIDPNLPGRQIRQIVHALEEIELTPVEGQFSPVELSPSQRRELGLSGRPVFAHSWNYRNSSKPMPELGESVSGGVPRRQFFGDLYFEIDPPERTDKDTLAFSLHPAR